MPDTSMTYESLRSAASKMDKAKNDLDDITSFVDKTVRSLEGDWSGEAYRAFVEAWQQSKPTMQRLAEAVERFAPALRERADKQEALEGKWANEVKDIAF